VAELFAREGAKVAITAAMSLAATGHSAHSSAGGKTIFLRTDVRKAAECQRAVDETLRSFGRLDILFNNAESSFRRPRSNAPKKNGPAD